MTASTAMASSRRRIDGRIVMRAPARLQDRLSPVFPIANQRASRAGRRLSHMVDFFGPFIEILGLVVQMPVEGAPTRGRGCPAHPARAAADRSHPMWDRDLDPSGQAGTAANGIVSKTDLKPNIISTCENWPSVGAAPRSRPERRHYPGGRFLARPAPGWDNRPCSSPNLPSRCPPRWMRPDPTTPRNGRCGPTLRRPRSGRRRPRPATPRPPIPRPRSTTPTSPGSPATSPRSACWMAPRSGRSSTASRPTSGPRDAKRLARELVSAKRLTAYQAGAICQGKAKGLVIGRFVVLDKLGAGGMGVVFKAEQRRLKRVVAAGRSSRRRSRASPRRSSGSIARPRRRRSSTIRISSAAPSTPTRTAGCTSSSWSSSTAGTSARSSASAGPCPAARPIDCRGPGGARARCGARAGDRPSRRQAVEPHPRHLGDGQGARPRPRPARRPRRLRRGGRRAHAHQRLPRHGRLHVARAGVRPPPRRRPLGYLQPRLHAPLSLDRQARLRRPEPDAAPPRPPRGGDPEPPDDPARRPPGARRGVPADGGQGPRRPARRDGRGDRPPRSRPARRGATPSPAHVARPALRVFDDGPAAGPRLSPEPARLAVPAPPRPPGRRGRRRWLGDPGDASRHFADPDPAEHSSTPRARPTRRRRTPKGRASAAPTPRAASSPSTAPTRSPSVAGSTRSGPRAAVPTCIGASFDGGGRPQFGGRRLSPDREAASWEVHAPRQTPPGVR